MFEQNSIGASILSHVEGKVVNRVENEASLEMMLTNRQVADFLQVSICTVRRWSDKGMLKYYRVGSRGDRRYRRADVLSFLENPPAI